MRNCKQQAQQGGFAMILVLCVGALFVALATALLFAASLLTAGANRQLIEQEVYGMASTFSDRLDDELVSYDSVNPAQKTGLGDRVLQYLYHSSEDAVTFACNTDLTALGGAEELSVTLSNKRKETNEPVSQTTTVTLPDDDDAAKTELKNANQSGMTAVYLFDVTVTAKLKGQTFAYTQSYRCESLPYYTFGTATTVYTYDERKDNAFFDAVSGKKTVAEARTDALAGTDILRHNEVGDDEPTAARFTNRADQNGGEASP